MVGETQREVIFTSVVAYFSMRSAKIGEADEIEENEVRGLYEKMIISFKNNSILPGFGSFSPFISSSTEQNLHWFCKK